MPDRETDRANQVAYACVLAVVTPLGFATKFYAGPGAAWVAASAGGFCYVLFWVFVVLSLAPSSSPRTVAVWVLGVTSVLELLQLWHPPFLEAIRSTFFGHALIGSTFSWWDFATYVLAALAAPALARRARSSRMRRVSIAIAATFGLCVAYLVAHWALIEIGRDVIVLRTENQDGGWLETRLWIVDDGAFSWLHGGDSGWMRNLEARPIVEIERGGETRRYRAHAVPGPHPELHELLRAKYGVADRWVRFVGPDNESTTAVRLDPIVVP